MALLMGEKMFKENDMKEKILERYGKDYSSCQEVAEDIRSMYVRGANDIGRMAAFGLYIFAENYTGEARDFIPGLEKTAALLFHTRPTAVSLENALFHVLNAAAPRSGLQEMKDETRDAVFSFFQYATRAQERVAELACGLIKNGFVIHTHCNSTAVVKALTRAGKRGMDITVHSTESRPRYQGRITVKQLAAAGIPTRMMVDSAARLYMDNVDLVLVGADTITYKGELYNKIGTHQIALAAKDCGVPLYALAETFKFSPRSKAGKHTRIELRDPGEIAPVEDFSDIEILNPSFDHTPPELVKGIVTEDGIVPPGRAAEVIDEKYGTIKTDYFY